MNWSNSGSLDFSIGEMSFCECNLNIHSAFNALFFCPTPQNVSKYFWFMNHFFSVENYACCFPIYGRGNSGNYWLVELRSIARLLLNCRTVHGGLKQVQLWHLSSNAVAGLTRYHFVQGVSGSSSDSKASHPDGLNAFYAHFDRQMICLLGHSSLLMLLESQSRGRWQ